MKLSITILAVALSAPAASYSQGVTNATTQKSGSLGSHRETAYKATGTVKKIDKAKGTVTLMHGPVKELRWSSMTMNFSVKNKSILDKLSTGNKVEFEFVRRGKDYVVTSVR